MRTPSVFNFAIVHILAVACLCVGCLNVGTPPTTQPSTLTPTQQAQINVATNIQNDADLLNAAFQDAAIFDKQLAPYAVTAAKVDKEIDTLVGQYVDDVTAGTVPPATLLAQIQLDLAQILTINAKSTSASMAFMQAKVKRVTVAR